MSKLVVKWTSKILSFSRKGLLDNALCWFLRMRRANIEPNETTFSTTLTVCSKSTHKAFGLSLHSLVLKKGYPNQFFVSNGLISMYNKFGRIGDARQVFDEMPKRDGFVWISMISGYSQNRLGNEACRLFYDMVKECGDLRSFVNDVTIVSILNASAHGGYFRLGESMHCYAVKLGFGSDVFVGSSLVDMYSKCEELDNARWVFDEMGDKDIVVWNTMISGYAQNSCEDKAIDLFLEMENGGISPNYTTFSVVIDASSAMPDGGLGRSFHAKTLKLGILLDVYLGTALVDVYSKFLAMTDAERAFGEMVKKSVVSYNALITGHGLIGEHENGLNTYMLLRLQGMKPDAYTFIGLFASSATSSTFFEGSQVHSHSILVGMNTDVLVGNSIVNFYSKFGLIHCAVKVFETAHGNDVVSWTAIISGLVLNNQGNKALEVFYDMNKLSIKADEFSSSSVIKAVASLAAVALGRHLHVHVIKIGLDHKIYVGSALIDMYSKCGMVEDAHKFFSELPEKNVVSWNSLITGYAQNGFPNEALLLFHDMDTY